MVKATIPLAKSLNLDYFKEEIVVMEKFDGVPIRVVLGDAGEVVASTTRPGEATVSSVQHLVDEAQRVFGDEAPCTVVFEVIHPTIKAFKDVSGLVRKDQPCPELIGMVWECDDGAEFFLQRLRGIDIMTDNVVGDRLLRCPAYVIVAAGDTEAYKEAKDDVRTWSTTPSEYFEGWIARCTLDPFIPNKRQPGYQKDVIEPTVDLKIVGFEEATANKDVFCEDEGRLLTAKGQGLGMVGRIIAEYKGGQIGVGPGKLSHDERRELWSEWVHWQGAIASGYKTTKWSRIAEIKHKRDPSYTALRQPTFQHWRDDKTEPSEEI